MLIQLITNEKQPSIKEITFFCENVEYSVQALNKGFEKAHIVDLYNDDVDFITIDFFEDTKYPLFTKVIAKSQINYIDIYWNSEN